MRLPPPFPAWPMALGLAVVASLAGAQPLLTRERVEEEIARTEHRIEQAEMLVSGTDSEEARHVLREAREVQRRARSELADGRLRVALDLTLRARMLASRAVAVIRGLPDPDKVRMQLERTRHLIEQARDRIEECGDVRARSMLNAAAEMQQRAEMAFAEDRFLAALQLTTSARERALRALRLCNLQENDRDRVDRVLRRTDEVIARARLLLDENGSDRARRLLERAEELQERAYAELRADRLEAALRLTRSARAFAQRAIRAARNGS